MKTIAAALACVPIFLGTSAYAFESNVLVIAGGADATRHENVSKLAFDVAQRFGQKALIATNKKWEWLPGQQFLPADSGAQMGMAFSFFGSARNPEKFSSAISLVFINDHGGASSLQDGPIASTIVLGNGELWSGAELSKQIKQSLLNQKYVRLVGIQCYSGGLHEISFENENTCSASNTDFASVSNSDPKISAYGKGFWEEIRNPRLDLDGDGKVNLMEAHFAGALSDTLNEGKGQTSSMAYVDKVLAHGPYRYSLFNEPPAKQVLNGETTLAIAGTPKGIAEGEMCKIDPKANFLELIGLINGVDTILSHSNPFEMKGAPSGPLAPIYASMREKWLKEQPRMVATLIQAQKDTNELKTKWKSLSKAEQLNQNGTYTKKFEEIDDHKNQALAPMYLFWRFAEYAKNLEEFESVASPEQKQKLSRLLACELAPL